MSAAAATRLETPPWLANLYELRQRVRWTMLIRIYSRRVRVLGRGPRSVIWMQAALTRWRLMNPAMSPRRAGR